MYINEKNVFLVLALMLLFSCDTASSTNPEDDTNNNSFISRSVKVLDHDGDFVGYATSVESDHLTIISSTGYIYSCGWDFVAYSSKIYATGAGGTGTLYQLRDPEDPPHHGKTVFRMGNSSSLLTYKNINANGLAQETATSTTFESYIDYESSTFVDSSYSSGSWPHYEVKMVTYSDIGFPDFSTITFPLELQFDDE